MDNPLELPENFDPAVGLPARITENGAFHEIRGGANLAADLVAGGTPADLAVVESVIDAVLTAQERRPNDPHYGNFFWMAEDEVVTDLNAVEFVLERLIPMMSRHAERLSPALRSRVLDAIRLGLDEIRRLDVHVGYSNMTMLDIVNSSLGGELIGDEAIANRGYQKLAEWLAFTDQSGIPREYNSPTYTAVILRAFKTLTDLTTHEPTRIRARTFVSRIALSVVLHIHRATGRWTGPHSRAYQPSVVCDRPPEICMINEWLEDGTLPAWSADLLAHPAGSFSIHETASLAEGLGLSTFNSPAFALGVASKGFGDQADVLMAHYVRDGAERPGVLYSRYVMNDRWLGDYLHDTDRTRSRNLVEEGQFFGVQQGPRVVGLYAPRDMSRCHSAKATFVFTECDQIDEIWVEDERINSLPAAVPDGAIVVIGSGSVYIAVKPLRRTKAGRDVPLRLVEKQGDLVLEIYNYLGPAKPFWEFAPQPNPFFQGHPHLGVYVELADRGVHRSGHSFGRVVAGGTFRDDEDEPFTTDFRTERLWTVEYERDGERVGIEVDLMNWTLTRRWTQSGAVEWPLLEAPGVRSNRTGTVVVDGATLRCGQAVGWLYSNPASRRWVAGYHGPAAAPVTLDLPDGRVEIESMGTGTIVWDAGVVTIDALNVQGTPRVIGGRIAGAERRQQE